jgi:hypothetical protein
MRNALAPEIPPTPAPPQQPYSRAQKGNGQKQAREPARRRPVAPRGFTAASARRTRLLVCLLRESNVAPATAYEMLRCKPAAAADCAVPRHAGARAAAPPPGRRLAAAATLLHPLRVGERGEEPGRPAASTAAVP